MLLIDNASTDPLFNLALEEYILTQTDWQVIMLWRNSKSVIVGCNQNAVEEIDLDYVRDNNITVVRRQSGGGAVFHDLGNINFTVIHPMGEDDFSNYDKFTRPICAYLQQLGVDAQRQGRNDLVIGGMKFSGNAQAVKKNRIMHHGTILYNADFGDLGRALRPRPAKISSKGIKSVRSRVTNVASHLPQPMAVEDFLQGLLGYFAASVPGIRPHQLSAADVAAVEQLVQDKYSRWEWNFGRSPRYDYHNSLKFEFGLLEIKLTTHQGVIQQAHLFGDFFGVADKSHLEALLQGVRHDPQAVLQAVAEVDLSSYIHGIAVQEFIRLF